MLTYEGCFGEKGFEEHCEIEWERKTIEGNVCIRPLGKSQPKQPLGFGGQTRDARVRSAKLGPGWGTHSKIGRCEFQKDSVEPHAHRIQGLYSTQYSVQ